MRYEIEFKTEEEKENIIKENNNKYLTEIQYLIKGNFLIFSDTPSIENKISILESENADLLLDSANKDIQMKTLEKDLADLTLIVGGI